MLATFTKLLLIWALCNSASLAHADDDDNAAATYKENKAFTLILPASIQQSSGIKTQTLEADHHQNEFEAQGKVIALDDLLALRERFLVAQAELKSATAKLKQTQQTFKRQQALVNQGIAAKRLLQELEAQSSADQAMIDTSKAKLSAIGNEAMLNWGKTLAEWALAEKSSKLKPFLNGQQKLLLITLPANFSLNETKKIFVETSGQRDKALTAEWIARATQMDNAVQGESYYFQVHSETLRTGMKLSVWIPETTTGEVGVFAPKPALLWYMDQLYVYVKVSDERFERRSIQHYEQLPEGFFIKDDLKAGDEIVVIGGQMLLSEELKTQIPDED